MDYPLTDTAPGAGKRRTYAKKRHWDLHVLQITAAADTIRLRALTFSVNYRGGVKKAAIMVSLGEKEPWVASAQLRLYLNKFLYIIKPLASADRLRIREEVAYMEDQGFRHFYKTLMRSYCLPAETAKKLLGKILHSLAHRKRE